MPLTTADLRSVIENQVEDNILGAITPADMRNALGVIADILDGVDPESAGLIAQAYLEDCLAAQQAAEAAVADYLAAADGSVRQFETREEFVLSSNSFNLGQKVMAGKRIYVRDGGEDIQDLDGYSPFFNITPEHWKTNATPGTTPMDTAIASAMAYAASAASPRKAVELDGHRYLVTQKLVSPIGITLEGQKLSFRNDYVSNGLILSRTWLTVPEGFDDDIVVFTAAESDFSTGYPRVHSGLYNIGIHGNRTGLYDLTATDRNSVGSGVLIDGASYVTLHNVCVLRCAEYGVLMGTKDYGGSIGYRSSNNNHWHNVVSLQNGLDGFRAFGGDNIFSDLVAGANGRDGINCNCGPISGGRFWNNTRFGVALQGSGALGSVPLEGGSLGFGVSLSGIESYDNGEEGVAILSGSGHSVSSDCRIYDNGRLNLGGNSSANISVAEAAGKCVIGPGFNGVLNRAYRVAAIGTPAGGSGYTPGTYSNVPLTGGSGTGATATITVSGGGAVTEVIMDNRGGGYRAGTIVSLGAPTGGTGYVAGTYTNVPLSGGSGSGARATVVVGAGGNVTTVTLTSGGGLYTNGNALSASNSYLGGSGSGFSVAVTSAPYDTLSALNTNLGGSGSGFSVGVTVASYPFAGNTLYGISATSGQPNIVVLPQQYTDDVTPYNITDITNVLFPSYRFRSRAALVANVDKIPTGEVARFMVGTAKLHVIKDGGTSIADLPGCSPIGKADLRHWRTSTSVAATDAAGIAAVAWMNAGTGRALSLPGGALTISAPWPAITAADFEVDGNNTQVIQSSTLGGTNGKFLIFGSDTTAANRGRVHSLTFQCNNTPDQNHFAFDWVNAVSVDLDAKIVNAASVLRVGGLSTAAVRCDFNVRGTFNKGLNADNNFLIQNAANCIFRGATTGTGGAANTNTTGAILRIKPPMGGSIDTMRFEGITSACVSEAGAADGKPYGIDIDTTDGTATNLYFGPGWTFDHTSVAAVRMIDAVSSTGNLRGCFFVAGRTTTGAGRALLLAKASTGNARWVGIRYIGNFIEWNTNNPAIDITGPGYDQCVIANNAINDSTATSKPQAILANADGWSIMDNLIGPNTHVPSGTLVGIEITNADITNIRISGNQVSDEIPTPLKVPASFTNPNAVARRIDDLDVPYPFAIPPTGEHIGTYFVSATSLGTTAGVADRLELYPYTPGRSFTADRAIISVTTAVAAAQAKIMIYASNNNGYPGALLHESAALDCSTTGQKSTTISMNFIAGRTYWLGARHSSTATLNAWGVAQLPALNGGPAAANGASGFRRTLAFATGAPNPWVYSSADRINAALPAVWLRIV